MVPIVIIALVFAAEPVTLSAKEALQPFNVLIGSWKCTGKADDRDKTFWSEKSKWSWKFEKDEPQIALEFSEGKFFRSGLLKYDGSKKEYLLQMTTAEKTTIEFTGTKSEGPQKELIFTFERTEANVAHRLLFSLLHSNRYLMSAFMKPVDGKSFARQYLLGGTKEGEPFAVTDKSLECVVTGGKGTISVSYKGKTCYVCCSGCKDEFLENPEKYIKK